MVTEQTLGIRWIEINLQFFPWLEVLTFNFAGEFYRQKKFKVWFPNNCFVNEESERFKLVRIVFSKSLGTVFDLHMIDQLNLENIPKVEIYIQTIDIASTRFLDNV